MKTLVTGGAGFIGRWVTARLIRAGHRVVVFDNLSNGRLSNLDGLEDGVEFVEGDIRDMAALDRVFTASAGFDAVFHLAASINVQDSIDDPRTTFDNDVAGTFNVLEECRRRGGKMVFMSTCMVYERGGGEAGINEEHPVKPASPYAASKLAGEALTLSYFHAYGLPAVVLRPFNTYGPCQKSSGEGGVVAIFLEKHRQGRKLAIYGDGTQTRDLLYVEDCADFVVRAGLSPAADGMIINAGLGRDITINDLALLVTGGDRDSLEHVPHIHPRSEIMKLLCDSSRAREVLGWKPAVFLEEGIEKTRRWMESAAAEQ